MSNPEGPVGKIVHADGLSLTTLNGSKMQIFANKANGEEKMAKRREEKNYDYQYTQVYKLNEEGEAAPDGFVMEQNHWEYDAKAGRRITIIYLYAADKGYYDQDEFKARSKALNKGRAGDMTLEELEAYEKEHNIPAIAPEQLTAIQALKKHSGK